MEQSRAENTSKSESVGEHRRPCGSGAGDCCRGVASSGALVVARLKAEADETVGCLWGQGDGKREEFGDGLCARCGGARCGRAYL